MSDKWRLVIDHGPGSKWYTHRLYLGDTVVANFAKPEYAEMVHRAVATAGTHVTDEDVNELIDDKNSLIGSLLGIVTAANEALEVVGFRVVVETP